MLEAAIFDMDGLLIDSEPFWRQSHIAALREYDVTVTEDDIRVMAGKRTDEVVEHWRETYQLQHIPNDVLASDILTQIIGHIKRDAQALDGAKELLKLFQDKGVPTAIASSSPPEVIEVVINKLQISDYIKFAYSAKHETFGKPHPAVFLTTAQKLGVAAANCVVFEDAASGIKAAKTAGMKCIAVPEAVNFDKPEIQEADLVLHSLTDVKWTMIDNLWR